MTENVRTHETHRCRGMRDSFDIMRVCSEMQIEDEGRNGMHIRIFFMRLMITSKRAEFIFRFRLGTHFKSNFSLNCCALSAGHDRVAFAGYGLPVS